MASCCHLTRRQLLKWGGLVAATPIVGALGDMERAYGLVGDAGSGPMLATNLELVTLTETCAILTWFTGDPTRPDDVGRLTPVPADTEVLLGTTQADLRPVFFDAAPTPYHYAELTGLEPGRPYVVVARSNGVVATASPSSHGSPLGHSMVRAMPEGRIAFTTPEPPKGSYLFSIALCNDLHVGETVAGLATQQAGQEIPPGIRQVDGGKPYPEVMAAALTGGPRVVGEAHTPGEARERGADLLLAAGDITAEAKSGDVVTAKSFLDGFGAQGTDYLLTRGNHDRHHTGSDDDAFKDTFFPEDPTWFAHEHRGLRIIGLDTYDKVGNGGDNGMMSPTQVDFLRQTLTDRPEQQTIVFGHHPVGLEASVTTTEPIIFDLEPRQSMELESLYAETPGVFLHHAGHTHRNKRTLSTICPDVVFQEVAATKEYPGGFHLLRVFTGGYALNYYKFRHPMAQEWAERSRPEYGGLAPFYTFGNVADRNSIVERDLSDLQPVTPVRRR